jgi:tetratricopeptide (TPR) repeat protein
MGFWNALFGGTQLTPEEEERERQAKQFDLLKYDGVRAMKTGQADYALRCFTEALKLRDDLEVHEHLSQVLLHKGELDEAMAHLEVLATAEPANVAVKKTMARVAYMKEDYAAMQALCEEGLSIDGQDVQLFFLSGQALSGQGNPVGAIAMLTKAIALRDDYADAYLLRGQTLLSMGDVNSASQDAQWLTDQVGDQEDVLLFKAKVEERQGNIGQAVKTYDRLIEVNPFSTEGYEGRGRLKLSLGDKAGAEADMQKVLELDPQRLADVSGEYSAEGIEQRVKQAYSFINPLGL